MHYVLGVDNKIQLEDSEMSERENSSGECVTWRRWVRQWLDDDDDDDDAAAVTGAVLSCHHSVSTTVHQCQSAAPSHHPTPRHCQLSSLEHCHYCCVLVKSSCHALLLNPLTSRWRHSVTQWTCCSCRGRTNGKRRVSPEDRQTVNNHSSSVHTQRHSSSIHLTITMIKRSERRKHCALAVVRRSQKFLPHHRPPFWGHRTAKI